MTTAAFTTEQKLKAIQRELALRRHHYPRWIASGALNKTDANFQIAIFEAIEADYAAKLAEENPKLL